MIQSTLMHSPFFEDKGNRQYVLNADKLAYGMCHMFYPMPSEEMWIATALQHSIFHPNTLMNQLFDVEIVQAGSMQLMHCSFPEKFKCLCERIAKIFHMHISYDPRAVVFSPSPEESLTYLYMHSNEQVLLFNKEASFPKAQDDSILERDDAIRQSLDEMTQNGMRQVGSEEVCDRLRSL